MSSDLQAPEIHPGMGELLNVHVYGEPGVFEEGPF